MDDNCVWRPIIPIWTQFPSNFKSKIYALAAG